MKLKEAIVVILNVKVIVSVGAMICVGLIELALDGLEVAEGGQSAFDFLRFRTHKQLTLRHLEACSAL